MWFGTYTTPPVRGMFSRPVNRHLVNTIMNGLTIATITPNQNPRGGRGSACLASTGASWCS